MQIKSLLLTTLVVVVGATAVAASLDPASSNQVVRRHHQDFARRTAVAAAQRDTEGTTETGSAVDPASVGTDPNQDLTQVAQNVTQQVTAPLLQIAAAVDLSVNIAALLQTTQAGLQTVLDVVQLLLQTLLGAVRRSDDPTSAVSGATQSAVTDASTKVVGAAKDAAQHLLDLKVDLKANVDLGALVQSVFTLIGQLVQALSELVPSLLDVCTAPLKELVALVDQLVGTTGTTSNPLKSALGGIA
ncbi:hypothetical protein A4X13_0g475 [Tilletia indica]|uniref:Uncharacterized protein n=1 Tax=Tilletia indica TaxID=43049 RepID=A0A177TJ15_9BASI|nr:hypothetical protein A4X13_0g475 [Tilletia indica]